MIIKRHQNRIIFILFLLLWILYSGMVHNFTNCHSYKVCQLNQINNTDYLREVMVLPQVTPDRCVQTAKMFQGTQTTICIKPLSVDKFVSGSILSQGAWEKNIVNLVLKAMDIYKTAVFLDIGANIGMYTVMVAATKRKVVAVDAVMENLAYINHSLSIASTSQYVKLLGNPISDKIETLYPVTDNKDNQGGTRLVPGHNLNENTKAAGPPVNTTTLHDVVKFVDSSTIIVKMDVEGFECKVLHPYLLHQHSSSSIFLPYIILEWMHIKVNLDSNCPDLMGMVDLLYKTGYEPYDLGSEKKMDGKIDWKKFTDVLWAHKDAVKLL